MKTDIFSLGVIMFALVLNRFPFEYAIPSDKLYSLISEGKAEQFWMMHRKSLEKAKLEEGNSET
jgi:serine/threonine protein kinase